MRRAPPERHLPTVTLASRGASQPTSLPVSRQPVHKGAPRRPPRTAARRERKDTNQSSMGTTSSMDRATATKWCLNKGGRETDSGRATLRPRRPKPPQPTWTQPRPQGGRQPSPPPDTPQAPDRPGCTGPPTRGCAAPSQAKGARKPRKQECTHTKRARGAARKCDWTEPAVPASKEKGHPDATTRHPHRERCEGREEPKGKRENRHRF